MPAFAHWQSSFATSKTSRDADDVPRRRTMTRIAIIGTGNVGSAVGAGAAKAGCDVVFAGQDADKAESVAEGAGASAVTTPREAVAGADFVVLAVPYDAGAGEIGRA